MWNLGCAKSSEWRVAWSPTQTLPLGSQTSSNHLWHDIRNFGTAWHATQINVPRARIARENLVPQHILSKIGHSQIEAAWLQFFSWFDMNSFSPPVGFVPSTWGIKRHQRNCTTWVITVLYLSRANMNSPKGPNVFAPRKPRSDCDFPEGSTFTSSLNLKIIDAYRSASRIFQLLENPLNLQQMAMNQFQAGECVRVSQVWAKAQQSLDRKSEASNLLRLQHWHWTWKHWCFWSCIRLHPLEIASI